MTVVAMIGYGEVGRLFASDLRKAGLHQIVVFDIAAAATERANADGLPVAESARQAAIAASLVIVAVTAGSVLDAMRSLEDGVSHGPLVLDVNSVSPVTKRRAAETVEAHGGRYVEAAIMTSVPPHGLRAPMLLGGSHAQSFRTLMAPLGMDLTFVSDTIGEASSIKMCRSVFIKGLECLAIESMLTAHHFGVTAPVLSSLADTLPHNDWPALVRYMISRALLHGTRRAEEMREAAETVRQAGLEPLCTTAVADRQAWAAERGQRLACPDIGHGDLGALLSHLAALGDANDTTRPPGRPVGTLVEAAEAGS